MAKDLNKVMIIGRLGADPELRYTQGGQAICSFRVASGRSWRDAGGNQHEDTEWFRVVAWDKLGGDLHPVPDQGQSGLCRGPAANAQVAGRNRPGSLQHRGGGRRHDHARQSARDRRRHAAPGAG